MNVGSTFKIKIAEGKTVEKKGVPCTRFRFSEKDPNGTWHTLYFTTTGTYPCDKTDGFQFIPKSVKGIYVMSSGQYTNVYITGEADVFDRDGNPIKGVDKDAEAQFKAITGNLEDLPF